MIRKKLRHVHSLCRSGPASRVLVVRDRQSSARTKLVFSILASNRDEYKLRPTARAAFWSDHSKGTCSIIIKQTRKQNMSMRGGICGTAGRGLVCRTVATLYCFPKKKKKGDVAKCICHLEGDLNKPVGCRGTNTRQCVQSVPRLPGDTGSMRWYVCPFVSPQLKSLPQRLSVISQLSLFPVDTSLTDSTFSMAICERLPCPRSTTTQTSLLIATFPLSNVNRASWVREYLH